MGVVRYVRFSTLMVCHDKEFDVAVQFSYLVGNCLGQTFLDTVLSPRFRGVYEKHSPLVNLEFGQCPSDKWARVTEDIVIWYFDDF